MRFRKQMVVGSVSILLTSGSAMAAGAEFRTNDPLRAFVQAQYTLGSDYFIQGTNDTVLLRCLLPTPEHAFEGIALSERSIWGNRRGDWEIFRKTTGGMFVYVGTRQINNTACLESCRSKDYVATGRCTWTRGWLRHGGDGSQDAKHSVSPRY